MKKNIVVMLLLIFLIMACALCSCGVREKESEEKSSDGAVFAVPESEIESETYVHIETPTIIPTETLVDEETEKPTQASTEFVLETPTESATERTTETPTEKPTERPTETPTETPTESPTEPPTEPPTQAPIITIDQKVDAKLASMTLKEKIYQMMIILPEQLIGQNVVTGAGTETQTALKKYPVGGLIYFGANLKNPTQTKTMISNTLQYGKESNGLPLFICIDEEGGRVARIGNLEGNPFKVTIFEKMSEVVSVARAGEVGSTIGAYLKESGFNVNFAPNADVLTNPLNTVIGNRSFGSDSVDVSNKALAFAKGLKKQGILATYKHFPGHGATLGDTHEGFAYTDKKLSELESSELVPFVSAANNNIDFVMTAHISLPNVVGDNTPTSLSYKMVTEVLKKKIGYKGLIVTDSLRMGAVTNVYTNKEIAVMAIKAGNDILLMPKDIEEAANAIMEAVGSGEITQSRIDESVRKILKVKMQME